MKENKGFLRCLKCGKMLRKRNKIGLCRCCYTKVWKQLNYNGKKIDECSKYNKVKYKVDNCDKFGLFNNFSTKKKQHLNTSEVII